MSLSKTSKKTLLVILSIVIISALVLAACGAESDELAGAAGGVKGPPDDKGPKDEKPPQEPKNTKAPTEGGGPAKATYSTKEHGVGHVPSTICHATGSKKNPYVVITIDKMGELEGHQKHPNDIIPMGLRRTALW